MRQRLYLILIVLIVNCGYAFNLNTITNIYFFGDSLTDSGFNDLWPVSGSPPLPAGKAPTFTTYGGYIWSQYIARDLKGALLPVYPGPSTPDLITNNSGFPFPNFVSGTLSGFNFAAGGSTTNSTGFHLPWAPSLHQQVSYFLQTLGNQSIDPNAVIFIWSGANDFLQLFSVNPNVTELDILNTAQNAANEIALDVAALSAKGAKRVVVMSLPNLGLTPFASSLGPLAQVVFKNASFIYNSMINTQLGNVVINFETKILFFDTYNLLGNVINTTQAGLPVNVSGKTFFFVNATQPACGAVASAIFCPPGTPSGYIFADMVHPTDLAHQVIALSVEKAMMDWG